ncbi:MAG: AEC family transporter [Sphaerochaetaceae bacterium]
MFLDSFIQLLPIFVLGAGGFFTSKLMKIDNETMIRLAADFFMPALVFHSLYTSDLSGSLVLSLSGATTLLIALLLAVTYLYAKAVKINAHEFMPASVFINAGFLGIPLMKLWGGLAAMNLIVIFDQVQTAYIFTFGVFIIAGGFSSKSLLEIVKTPVLWAIILGFAFKYLGLTIGEPILRTLEFAGNAAPPMAAYILGASLHLNKIKFNTHVVAGVVIRLAGGFLLGWACALIFGLSGLAKTVFIVASSIPSAIFTAVLPMRYNRPSAYAGSIVIISNVISIFTLPIAFMLASKL